MALVVRDLGLCPYADALAIQEEIVAAKLRDDEGDDTLLLVEHPPCYTLGRGADAADLCGAPERLGVPVFRVGRGGGVTFHGPGQLVAYPILALRSGRRDVRRYVRMLEEVLIRVCADFGVTAGADGPHPGVWVQGAKLAAIGVGIRRWVTLHGVALNVATELAYFEAVVPCRVAGLRVTRLADLCAPVPSSAAVRAAFVRHFTAALPAGDRAVARAGGETAAPALAL